MKLTTTFIASICLLSCAHVTGATATEKTDGKGMHIAFNDSQPIDKATLDGKLFFQQIKGKTDLYGEARLPFIYPIIGPTGADMTRSYPITPAKPGEAKDHPHHTSLWFAHGNVNGVDFWHSPKAKIQVRDSTRAERIDLDEKTGELWIKDVHDWLGPNGKPILINSFKYMANQLADGSRLIDLSHELTPAQGVDKVTFGYTKEGTMAIRLAPQLRLKGEVATGQCINSEGHKNNDAWGKRAKWVAYWGVIDGKSCGMAIFDHPTNLRHPTWWHARDYGLVAANPFGQGDFEKKPKGTGNYTLKQGETLSLRYRFVFFAGTAEEADIAGKYDQWVKETTKQEQADQ